MSESSTPGPHVLATQCRCLAEAQSAVAENQGQRQYRNNPWYESVTHPLPALGLGSFRLYPRIQVGDIAKRVSAKAIAARTGAQ